MSTVQIVLLFVLVFLLLSFSAFFSGSETAFATSNKLRIENNAEKGDKRSKRAKYILDHFTESLSTILVGNNLVNIAASSAVAVIAAELFSSSVKKAQSVAAVILTVVLLIFGEILPKIMASEYSDRIALFVSLPLRILMIVFSPVVFAVSFLVGKISVLWTPKEEQPAVTQNELVTLLEKIEDEGVFSEQEGELIKSAIEFTDVTAREIMVPRVDVEAFDIDDSPDELKNNKNLLKYSRIPVYRETQDNIIGILPVKRFLRACVRDPHVDISSLLLKPVFVHMTRPISSILVEFHKTHSHMAVVVDEFGGTMGILTMEDILEEIVGDIYDEHDEVERDVLYTDEEHRTFVVDGSMNIYDFFDLVDFNPNLHDFESEYTTVGGWMTELLDRFPEKGDVLEYENLTLTVLSAQSLRVEKIRVVVSDPVEEEEEEDQKDETENGEEEDD